MTKRISIYEAMKKADALAKSRDDEFLDMMERLNKGNKNVNRIKRKGKSR